MKLCSPHLLGGYFLSVRYFNSISSSDHVVILALILSYKIKREEYKRGEVIVGRRGL